MNLRNEPILLSVTETAELLGLSIPTLREMRRTTPLGNLEIPIGKKRVKFSKEAVLKYINELNSGSAVGEIPTGQLSIGSTIDEIKLEVRDDLFDLRGIKHIDPYGALSLLTHLIGRSRKNKQTKLILRSTSACKKLKFLGFFDHLEKFAPMVVWDKKILEHTNYYTPESLMPITSIQTKGGDKRTVEQLRTQLVRQGFSDDLANNIGQLVFPQQQNHCSIHFSILIRLP